MRSGEQDKALPPVIAGEYGTITVEDLMSMEVTIKLVCGKRSGS
jgi:hypothetical protein